MAIYLQVRKKQTNKMMSDTLFGYLILATSFMLIMDTLGRCAGTAYPWYPILNGIGNFFIYTFSPITPFLWLLYIHNILTGENNRTKRIATIFLATFAVAVITIIATYGRDTFYYIDSQNIFHRGKHYGSILIYTAACIIGILTVLIGYHKQIHIKHILTLILFTSLGVIGAALQYILVGTNIYYSVATYSIVLLYLNIQNDKINEDYITGLSNRIYFDKFLYNCIEKAQHSDYHFAAIMMDIDDFKSINDTYGHLTGDHILKDVAKMLNKTTGKKNLVSRFAGDEFCAVINTDSVQEVQILVDSIYKQLDTYNRSKKGPCPVMLSIGYQLYNPKTYSTANAFIHSVDDEMYKCKKEHKVQRA